jgi:aryl-alcohol dehydrogenase-like predicted oxidoreductase
MKYKNLGKTNIRIPIIGQGCMGIGGFLTRNCESDAHQIELLEYGIGLGMTFIDTAEVYGEGHSEEIVGQAIKAIRDQVIIATKVSPEHLRYEDVIKSAEGSLSRLRTDYIDIYQVHWPNPRIPLEETMLAMEQLVEQGKIRYIGLSNFYPFAIMDARAMLKHSAIVSIQLEYNLFDRSIEDRVLPFCEAEGMTLIAYSPLDQGRITNPVLDGLAEKYGKTSAQIALNWLTSHGAVIAIPKAAHLRHLENNAVSVDFKISQEDLDLIDATKTSYMMIAPEKICVSIHGQGNRQVYQTKEDAVENKLGFVPSPADLAGALHRESFIKPVRLIKTKEGYDLIEGRVRYWAWVIAYGNKPIPAYVRFGEQTK